MVQALIGKKIDQTQAFLEDGTRVPVTRVLVAENVVLMQKTKDKDGYDAVQIGAGTKKNSNKAILGHVKGAKLEKAPFLMREVMPVDAASMPEIGKKVTAADVFKPGDMIDVVGFSKGKGYAGVVKRHHFKGGPRTHGQSDRERAPGSIGQTTTPGRVYKGKRMAGRMGSENVTIKNLNVLQIVGDELWVKGLIPGVRGGYVVIEKIGEMKKFVPLYQEQPAEEAPTVQAPQEEIKPQQEASEPQEEATPEVQSEAIEQPKEEKEQEGEKNA